MMEAHRGGQHQEQGERHPGERLREELAAGFPGCEGVPDRVGRQQPEVDQRVPEEPEQGPGQQRIHGLDQAQGPRNELEQHLRGDSHGGEKPEHRVGHGGMHRKAGGPVSIAPPGVPPGSDHAEAPPPGRYHDQRQADVEGGMGLERRVEGVEDAGLEGENRPSRGHHAGGGQPEHPPGQPGPLDVAVLPLGHRVAQRHDEEGGEHQRHEDAVGGDRHVVHPGRPVGHLEVGAGDRLHDGHARGDPEGQDRDPEMGQDQPVSARHGCLPRGGGGPVRQPPRGPSTAPGGSRGACRPWRGARLRSTRCRR